MSFDFMNQGQNMMYGGGYGYNAPVGFMAPVDQATLQQQQAIIKQQQAMRALETPTIVTSGQQNFFSVVASETDNTKVVVPVDSEDISTLKKKGRPRRETGTGIVRAEAVQNPGTVEDVSSQYNYMETTGMLRETLMQIDTLNSELMQEFSLVRSNRTMKNKYQILNGLTENVGALISNKISAIREINSSISKASDLDYKKDKDRRAANAAMDDDKYIADLYKSFIQNPANVAPTPQMTPIDPSIFGSGVVRADLRSGDYNSNGNVDVSYLNYMSNLTPEQNLMRYEGNGNVKQVVVFDAESGNKFFQMMDMSTGQVIPNVPVYDQMFMEDTTIDLKNKIAKNINLNETFPLIVINEGVSAQY